MSDSDGVGFDTNAAGDGVIHANKFSKTGRHMRLYGPDGNLYWNDEELALVSHVREAASHVRDPRLWGVSPGMHYWAHFGDGELWDSASAYSIGTVAGWGFSGADIGTSPTSSGDFISAADDAGPYLRLTASGQYMYSPSVFGSYRHALNASRFNGDVMPTKLSFECYARFATASANESTSGFGFSIGQGTPDTLHVAYIRSNGSNFQIRGSHDSDAGPAIDTNYHLWKAEAQSTGIEWWVDGVSQGTMTVDPTDMWPVAFSTYVSTTNRVEIAWAHVWYS